MEDLTGLQLGPFQIVAPLGEGGMAAVYQAYQPSMERYVALKVLPQHFAGDPQFAGRFEQEAKVIARLQHPHILPVFDYGQANGYTYIAMPFIKSGTLAALLKGTPLPLSQIGNIIIQVGDALDYAHSFGVVHRDIKPSNVLVDERGNCLLTDFGIAKIIEASQSFTRTGGIIGTPVYMSPEQGTGQTVDGRSDIYSLGIMLYEMATGRVPFDAETPIAIVFKHARDPLPMPRTLNPALPESVERVILKSLAKRPEDRYATAGAMVQALQAALAGRTASATSIESGGDQTMAGGARIEPPRGTYRARQLQSQVGAGAVPPIIAPPPVAVYPPGGALPIPAQPARRRLPAWALALGCLGGLGLTALLAAGAFVAFGPIFGAATNTPTPTPSQTVSPSPSASPTVATPTAPTATASQPPTATGGQVTRTATRTQIPTLTAPATSIPPSPTFTDTPITPTRTPTNTNTPEPEFVNQPSYAGDCGTRPPGTVCATFSDGYVWLITDSVAGHSFAGTFEGNAVEVIEGFVNDYHHPLGTTLARTVPK